MDRIDACKINKQIPGKHIDQLSLFPKRSIGQHKNKEQGKMQHETPRYKKQKGTSNKNYTRTTTLERSEVSTTGGI